MSLDSLIQAEFLIQPYVVVLHHDGFSAILVYVKNLQNASPITDFVLFSMSGDTIRPPHVASKLFIMEMSATTNEIQPRSRQTGSKPHIITILST